MSITSVISYATVSSDQLWVIAGVFFMTFHWWNVFTSLVRGPESSAGVQEVPVWGRHSVRSSPSSRDRYWSGQLPMSECPSTQKMAKRHTHSCLLALAWVTVSPTSESHRHPCSCHRGNDTELQVGDTGTTAVWGRYGVSSGRRRSLVVELQTSVTISPDHKGIMRAKQTGTGIGCAMILQKQS